MPFELLFIIEGKIISLEKRKKKGGKIMKKIVSFLICGILLMGIFTVSPFAAIKDDGVVMPMYNNTTNVTNRFVIEEGIAKVTVAYIGKFNTLTRAVITTKLQVQTSSGWVDVNNGEPNNQWVEDCTTITFSKTYNLEVPSGSYRALISYQMYGTGGAADVISKTLEYSY